MKHLLIILSILLLSSFLISCEEQTGVLYESDHSENSWYSDRWSPKDPKYEGEIKNKNPFWSTPNYEPHGRGTLTLFDGSNYVGEFKEGKKHGQGTFTWSNGQKYIGGFKVGHMNGQGTFTFGKGKWEGKWDVGYWSKFDKWWSVYGDYNGQGTFTWSNGQKYVGKYKDGEMDGLGTLTYGKGKWEGDRYVGEFKFGNFHGQGIYTFRDGEKIIGKFVEGKEWETEYFHKDGEIIGMYVNGEKSVNQIMILFHSERNGEWDWFEDGNEEKDGKYVGEIKNGKPNGLGIINYNDGTKKAGLWKDGKEWDTDHFKKDGTILGKYVDGKWGKYFILIRRFKTKSWFENLFSNNEKLEIIWIKDTDYKKMEKNNTGLKYFGQIQNGKPNGWGILYGVSGFPLHEGQFKDGKQHGQGTTFLGSTNWVGIWKDDEEWHVKTVALDGSSEPRWTMKEGEPPPLIYNYSEPPPKMKEFLFPPKTNQIKKL